MASEFGDLSARLLALERDPTVLRARDVQHELQQMGSGFGGRTGPAWAELQRDMNEAGSALKTAQDALRSDDRVRARDMLGTAEAAIARAETFRNELRNVWDRFQPRIEAARRKAKDACKNSTVQTRHRARDIVHRADVFLGSELDRQPGLITLDPLNVREERVALLERDAHSVHDIKTRENEVATGLPDDLALAVDEWESFWEGPDAHLRSRDEELNGRTPREARDHALIRISCLATSPRPDGSGLSPPGQPCHHRMIAARLEATGVFGNADDANAAVDDYLISESGSRELGERLSGLVADEEMEGVPQAEAVDHAYGLAMRLEDWEKNFRKVRQTWETGMTTAKDALRERDRLRGLCDALQEKIAACGLQEDTQVGKAYTEVYDILWTGGLCLDAAERALTELAQLIHRRGQGTGGGPE